MKNKDKNTLINALKVAQEAAFIISRPDDDGGTSNFDSVVLYTKGIRQTSLDSITEQSGIKFSEKLSGIWRNYRFIGFALHGQGHNRTRMAETACRILRQHGINCRVYYAID